MRLGWTAVQAATTPAGIPGRKLLQASGLCPCVRIHETGTDMRVGGGGQNVCNWFQNVAQLAVADSRFGHKKVKYAPLSACLRQLPD
jgi:hypothetical protein